MNAISPPPKEPRIVTTFGDGGQFAVMDHGPAYLDKSITLSAVEANISALFHLNRQQALELAAALVQIAGADA